MIRTSARIMLLLGFSLSLTCPDALGGDLTDPMEILKKADEAIKKVDLVSYEADYTATSWLRKFVPDVKGTVVLGEESEWEVAKFRVEVSIRSDKSSDESDEKTDAAGGMGEPLELTAGCDGDNFFLIDPGTKTVYRDMDPAVLGKHSRNLQRVLMREFTAKAPFEEELKAEEIKLEGTETVYDQECYKIRLKTKESNAVWYFAKKDFLPRRVDRIHKNGEGEEGMTKLVLSNLRIDPKLKVDPFSPNAPAGFKTTDDFAP